MRVVFIGTGEIGLPTLRWLRDSGEHELVGVVTQPDKPVGRDQRIQAPPIKAELGSSDVPVLQPERIKRPEAVEQLRALAPDVTVVMAYGQILPRSVLDIPPIACLNLHASLLPRHRGAAPIQSVILAGDAETGITVMYMDEGLDTGDILLKRAIPIEPDETGGSLHDRLAEISPDALAHALRSLENGNAPRSPQNSDEATYAPKLEREHGLIDWTERAELIERKIRAFNPWPGTYTVLRDEAQRERKLKIYRALLANDGSSAEGIRVQARNGALLLVDVQLEGKKRMSAAELMRGHAWIAEAASSLAA